MLSPEQIANIGHDAVRITQEEIDALLSMVSGEVAAAVRRGDTYRSLFDKSLDIQQQALRKLLRTYPELRDAAARTVVQSLAAQLDDDLERIGKTISDLPPALLADMHQSAAATAQGALEIVRRDNLAMAENVRQGFYNVSAKYIAMVNAGGIRTEDAVKRAVLELADKGIDTVQYKSGAKAQADVAMRRHLASQVTQVGGRRTMQIMDALAVELVEVSSHIGARPSHAAWQGKCYSMHGRVVLDGVVYEDFGLATGYFGQGPYGALGDRLQGVNCRHFFGPYLHGQPRTYSETPDEDAGYERGEVYKNTQKQRAYEREIRRVKRRIAALEGAGLSGSPEHSVERIKLGELQRELKKHVDTHVYLHRRYERERVAELKKQPRAQKPIQARQRIIKTKSTGVTESVNRKVVNGEGYKKKFAKLVPRRNVSAECYKQAGNILSRADGTQKEYMVAINAKTGKVITDTFGHESASNDLKAGFTHKQMEKVLRQGDDGVILMHNHPWSVEPSSVDLQTPENFRQVVQSLVLCHSGEIYSITDVKIGLKERYGQLIEQAKQDYPMATDMAVIRQIATKSLYEENGNGKWFKIKKL